MKKTTVLNLKNITETVCAIGLALSPMSVNNTLLVDGNCELPAHINHDYNDYKNSSNVFYSKISQAYYESSKPNLMVEATNLFGNMRSASENEQVQINKYIEKISKKTGVNFFTLC